MVFDDKVCLLILFSGMSGRRGSIDIPVTVFNDKYVCSCASPRKQVFISLSLVILLSDVYRCLLGKYHYGQDFVRYDGERKS